MDEQLSILTPERVRVHFVLAGAGNRFLALIVDLSIEAGILFVLFLAVIFLILPALPQPLLQPLAPATEKQFILWVLAIVVFLNFLVDWGYFVLFETIWSGQTPGKRWARIRVIREDGRPISFAEAMIRNLLRIVDWLPGLYAVGLIVMLFNRRSKRLGDYAAGTVVIKERRQAVPLKGPRLRIPPKEALEPGALKVRMLTKEEANLIQAFLRRREELDASTRSELARKIALPLIQRLQIPQAINMSYEALFEWLYEEWERQASFR